MNSKRKNQILSILRTLTAELLQAIPDEIEAEMPLLEMGVDSLVIAQAVRKIENQFGLTFTIRQIFEQLTTLDALANYIDNQLTPEWGLTESSSSMEKTLPPTEDLSSSPLEQEIETTISGKTLERVLTQQIQAASQAVSQAAGNAVSQVVSQQLSFLQNHFELTEPLYSASGASIPEKQQPPLVESLIDSSQATPPQTVPQPDSPLPAWRATEIRATGLNPQQQRYLENFVARYTQKTPTSKQLTQKYRAVLADNRASAGFRFSTKEMLYPIIGKRAQGAKTWDVDGNEYIDITMGFGVNLFGHQPPFMIEALETQLKETIQLGLQTPLAGEVAQLICELTGMERVTFCNSGTEAVMTALRLARVATGRCKIALFAMSYHGHFDGTLAEALANNDNPQALPMTPGVTPNMVADTLVLDYGNPQSLDIIRKHAQELAAVLVEPVQSRRPDLQPKAFLQQLRQLTLETKILLIFDEMITGFRIHPGGAQAWFGVQADIATYGKIVGGGMPIGVIAGKANYMNGIDGGFWNYGDASYPQADTTFFAGTFCKHPLAMAAALAVLKQIKQQGAILQERLNQRTTQLVDTLNDYFVTEAVPIRMVHFGSLFRFAYSGNLDLLYYHLLEKGIYVWEGRNCFLSTAHTEADIAFLIQTVQESVAQLREGGFLPQHTPKTQHTPSPSFDVNQTLKIPLTEAQKQLWVLTKIGNEGSFAYHVYLSLQLHGVLHLAAIRQAVQQVINRHQALRTMISAQGDFQQCLPSLQIELPIVDCSADSVPEREQKVASFFQHESQQSFELSNAPLFRVHLIQLAPQQHLLVLTAHHIVVDGLSMIAIVQEIAAFYSAICRKTICQLEAPMPWNDYVQWQTQAIQTAEMLTHESYWLEKLSTSNLQGLSNLEGFTNIPVLNLPTDRPHPSRSTYQGSLQTVQLSAELCHHFNQLSQQQACTPFMGFFAAYTILLHRLSSQNDIIVGIPVAGRNFDNSEQLVGYCTHLLPIRIHLTGSEPFLTYLNRIKTILLDAYEHQDYPFACLINKLDLQRDGSQSPLASTTFNLDRLATVPKMFDLTVEWFAQPLHFTAFDLSFNLTAIEDNWLLDCEYNTDIFDTATIQRWLGHFQTLLKGIIAYPQQPVDDLPLLSEAELQQFLEWNDTQTDYSFDKCIHQLFEEQVEKTPDAIAVVFPSTSFTSTSSGHQSLTYLALNHKANQLAHYLQSLGVQPEVIVGLCIERSLEMIIGLFGILKAGGAYLPLDPSYPQERLAFMLEDAQVSVLLTQTNLKNILPQSNVKTVCLDSVNPLYYHHTNAQSRAKQSIENPDSQVQPENLAYVIYTSGSTGKPKGVMVQHQSVVNFIKMATLTYGFTERDSILQFASISFDAATEEIYPCLTNGGKLVLRFDGLLNSVPRFLQHCQELGLTILDLPTAYWHQITAELVGANLTLPASLRLVIIGGEAAVSESVKLWQQQVGEYPSLVNTYGPTEATVVATKYPLPLSTPLEISQNLAIGSAIGNVQTYVLDNRLQRIPIGIPGELYLGGAGVARGYLNRPELTAKKFIPNPFVHNEDKGGIGGILYKTGDLVRYLPDGNLEYLGRMDNQVKIRGFRIEIGEIEAVLAQHDSVRENVVIVDEVSQSDKRLIAFIVTHSEPMVENAEFRRFMRERVPDYMVPSAFVPLESMPLTPSNKIDRSQLSVISYQLSSEDTLVAPRTPEEELLVGIWTSILGTKQIGVFDNFFELGGHSLLATQVVSRIRDTFTVELPLRQIFEFPTLADLSKQLLEARREKPLPPITPVNRDDQPLPLSFSQQRLWFLAQLEGDTATYNMPSTIRLEGRLHQAALALSLQEIIQRHESLRTSFPTFKGSPQVHLSVVRDFQLSLLDLQALSSQEQSIEMHRLVQEDAHKPFNLSKGLLCRFMLLQLGADSHILLMNMHHIVSDGQSIEILMRELSRLYQAFSQGKPSPLPPLPIQYVDFAHWQRQWLTKEVLEKQGAYWQQQLAGMPALLKLPTDRPRPPIQSFRGATIPLTLSIELTQSLKILTQQAGATLFMTLLSALATLLARYTGSQDIVIGSPIANRVPHQTESLIGLFLNTLVLRLHIDSTSSFEQLLRQTRKVAIAAYAHQDFPFEQLVDALQVEKNLSHSPLFQVMLVQNTSLENVPLSDLTLTLLESDTGVAKFDLTLFIEETASGLVGAVEYNTDLFEPATIERLIGHFQTLLTAIVEQPQLPIAELPLLTVQEQQQLIVWNNTTVDYPLEQCFHQLFEAQVERTPEAIAVVFENQSLTYLALNHQANQLAHYLQTLGIQPEILVGICVERSVEMIIGLLGILKAGGAYLPLEPSYPPERLAFMLEDSQASVLLTQFSLTAILPQSNVKTVYLDSVTREQLSVIPNVLKSENIGQAEKKSGDEVNPLYYHHTNAQSLANQSVENPDSHVQPENLAYVIYTSGSTGKPKGTLITHRGLVNYLCWCTQAYQVSKGAGVPLHSSIGFDATITSLFSPLLVGQTISLFTETQEKEALGTTLTSQTNWSLVKLTPAHLEMLNADLPTEKLSGLCRFLVLGGEALAGQSLSLWRTTDTRIINEYGPTETVVGCCVYEVSDNTPLDQTIPIGYPIANTQLYILDSDHNPAPIGVPGELYIGGVGLARGYLNRPELTAEKFIPNPFVPNEDKGGVGGILYKTGDLARYLPDGKIEYLGRIDNQVKIRGFRIELGEIEAVLAQHAQVRENAVIVHETAKSRRLVAYFVPQSPRQHIDNIDKTELRHFLQQRLPDYMIPSAFMILEMLPLTSNGKVDRQALSQMSVNPEILTKPLVAPRTFQEKILTDIWKDVLGVELIGVHDNFFELGGDSIISIQMISRANQAGLYLTPKQIFQQQTIAELVAVAETVAPNRKALPNLEGFINVPNLQGLPNLEGFNNVSSLQGLSNLHNVSNLQGLSNLEGFIEDFYPLSPMQEGMLFHTLYAPESGVYFEQLYLTFEGVLNQQAFQQAWQQLMDRYTILRTACVWEGLEKPIQIVLSKVQIPWLYQDWRDLPMTEQQAHLTTFLRQDKQQGFHLQQAPLMRCALIQITEEQHYFVWSYHHLLLDGWCLPILFQELFLFYEALCQGQTQHLTPARPYRDYIAWLQQQDMSQAQVFWQTQLQGFIAPTPFRVDHTKIEQTPTETYQEQTLTLSQPTTEALQSLAKQHHLTLNTLIQGVWALLLSHYSGEQDIVFGMTVSGRTATLVGIESMLGLFINTLPVRVSVPMEQSLLPWLQELQTQQVEREQYSFTSLVDIQKWSEIPSGQALFNSIVVFENYPMDDSLTKSMGSVTIRDIQTLEITNYPLTLTITPATELLFELSYESNCFAIDIISRLLGHLQTLLEGIIANPDSKLREIPWLTEAERHQLLITWNNRVASNLQGLANLEGFTKENQCIHHLFEAQVERTPEAIAVVFPSTSSGNQSLTYSELNHQANQLAHYLQSLGVKPEVIVGLCLERSLEMIIGLFGILKAGAAYLPLDPAYPVARLAFMLEDAQASVLLTQSSLQDILPQSKVKTICLDTEPEMLSRQSIENPESQVNHENLAYVIYTSGSIGKPKGVMIQHQSVVNFIEMAKMEYRLTEQDSILQFASISFDTAAEEIYPCLASGGKLVLRFDEMLNSVPLFLQYCRELGLTILDLPTAYWHQQLIPIGIPGELYLGGAGVARGYLNRPELTEEKFIPNPYGDKPGSRLYKTGDLVCYLPDGNLEYLGRIDNQVKIRGFRIEVGEIEAVLAQHSAVQESVVIIQPDKKDKQLVAFVVLKPEHALDNKELRAFLTKKLPDYMVPQLWKQIDAMPLTPNGKIDRQALSQLSVTSYQLSEKTFVVPRTPEEKSLAGIWATVLGLERVGIHNNFFELGGDSILSIQVISRASQVGLRLTPRHIFQHQTIAELAAVTETIHKSITEPGLVTGSVPLTPIQHWFFEQNVPAPHHFNQSVLLEVSSSLTPAHLHQIISPLLRHHDVLRIRVQRIWGVNGLVRKGTEDLVITDDCSLLTGNGALIIVVDLSLLTTHEQRSAIETTATQLQASLNLSEGIILRVALFQLGNEQPHRLLFIIHHLAVDGVSWRILLEDFAIAYQQITRGEAITLPPKTTSFRQWAQRLTEYAYSKELVAELDYWLTALHQPGLPIPLDYSWSQTSEVSKTSEVFRESVAPIPLDYSADDKNNTVATSIEIMVSLNLEQTRALLNEVPKVYRTQINDVLLTALTQSLAKWTGEPMLFIDLEGHGREALFDNIDLSRTVGWFTSVFPVLLDLRGVAFEPGARLKAIKEQLRHIPHHGIGYGLLRYLNTDTASRLQALPQAQVSFNYLGQFQSFSTEPILGWGFEDSGATESVLNPRTHLLNINGFISHDGQLQFSWDYSENDFQHSTIEYLAQSFITALQTLITHCQSFEAFGYTPSDFPLVRLEQATLDKIVAQQQLEDLYPLSPMQEGMLFHTLYTPESGVYFEQLYLTFEGVLNLRAFQQAWQQLIDRHAILRTAYVWKGLAKPLQMVFSTVQVPWLYQDWRGLPTAEQQKRFTSFLNQDRQQGFDLQQAPLMRYTLIQIAEEQHYFVWSHHHLLLDGWCLPILFSELFIFYEDICQQQTRYLAPARPYRDYIAWLQQQDMSKAQAFWQTQLHGFTAPTPFRVDKTEIKRPPEEISQEQAFMTLSRQTTEALQSLAKQHRLTLNTLVQGAWALLLSHYSGEKDIVFGATVSGRTATLAGIESMLGLFINTLPVRVSVPRQQSLLPWLQKLPAQQVEREQYSFTPLVEIQQWSEVLSGRALFESILVFENYPIDDSLTESMGSVTICDVQTVEITNYPLTLVVTPTTELLFQISYENSRFEADTIIRLLGHLQTILEGMIANPGRKLGELPWLTEAERQQLLVTWNAPNLQGLPNLEGFTKENQCLHHLLEAQVERTPEAIAVIFENQQLTYQELNTQANQLAHYLQTLGVKPEVIVGLFLTRSLEMVIGLLGILKAGGAYLPLDPAYPVARLAFMLEDAQIEVLLTQASLANLLPPSNIKTICLDTQPQRFSKQTIENPKTSVTVENLAYVIYTSGSTGKPKGTLIIHQGLVNYLTWCTQAYQVSRGSGAPVLSSIGFDATITSLFSPLLVGQTISLFTEQQEKEALNTTVVSQTNWSLVKLTPAHLEMLNAALPTKKLTGLCRFLILGGEALAGQSISLWRTATPDTRIINEYGPTETVVGCCVYEVSDNTPLDKMIPIGRPIANTQLYILDSDHKPVSIGVPGELYIGGVGLARGYLNRPELTAEKFIPNPLQHTPTPSFDVNKEAVESPLLRGDLGVCNCSRLYKTGDLARYLSDGNIEYLGRIDNQVKIRGFRIELGEIEAVLAQHPSVQESAVIVQEDSKKGKQLIACLVPNLGQVIDNAELRAFLTNKLPDYMIPQVWVPIEVMPLTVNGKIDRQALARLSVGTPVSGESFVAPRTPEEELLAGIWASILGVERVGVFDNFFERGGHSLLATQVVSRIRETFSLELPLRQLFESPTIAGLSEHLLATRRQEPLPPITPIERNQPLPLSFAQQRLWFLDQLEGENALYNVPGAIRIEGLLHTSILEQSLAEIIQRHETLRTTFLSQNGKPVQVIQPVSVLRSPLSLINLQALSVEQQDTEVQRLIKEDAVYSFDLSKGPLFRTTLLQLGDERQVLLVTLHHIISDGWSIGVLIRELSTLYEAFSQGKSSNLPPLTIQYVDFAHWQRQWLCGDVLNKQSTYWKQQLDGAPTLLELPTDKPRPPIQRFHGASLNLTLSPELTQSLKKQSQQAGSTLFMTLLSGFAILLSRYSGTADIVIGSPIANRIHHQIESLIGFFVNTLVLRLDIQSHQSFEQLLARTKQTALDAYAHQDIPFEQLVEELQPDRNLSHSPLFQVMFILHNTPMEELELSGLHLTPIPFEDTIATFDLTLSLEETQQGLEGTLEYNTDLWKKTTIERMIGHFQTLLKGIVKHPLKPISELPLLTAQEQQQLLAWNDTVVDYPATCIHHLFEAQVERTPEAIAVVFPSTCFDKLNNRSGNQSLTYLELNHQANQLAHYLQSLGVKPEVIVGLCLERSLEMIIGLFGILKAGGAYLPLDPCYPQQRLAFMLEDAQASILLTQSNLTENLPQSNVKTVYLDSVTNEQLSLKKSGNEVNPLYYQSASEQSLANQSIENFDSQAKPENLAYVIYTSGSTGKPKGVMIQHQSAVNFIARAKIEYRLTEQDSILQFASISFDAAAEEIYPCLISGGKLVLRFEGLLSSVPQFLQHCQQLGLTILDLPTAYWHQITSELVNANLTLPASLRLVIIGGEAALPESVKVWQQQVGEYPALINTYGPTEATVVATKYFLYPQHTPNPSFDVNQTVESPLLRGDLGVCNFLEEKGQSLPIGCAIGNVQTYVLDQHLQRLPIGVPGELHISGVGIARGYLNRPELTAEKFIPNPFIHNENKTAPLVPPFSKGGLGGILYKTGDLVRYLPDGNLEYLGRIDNQVKIRGFRIEMGEIEAVLAQHCAVQESAVIVQTDTKQDNRLVGFWVPKPEQSIDNIELRAFLQEKLPDYMIPQIWVPIETMPLTPNGKIDRSQLSVISYQLSLTSYQLSEQTFVAPRTPEEELLAGIWADILGVELVGIWDNFFELGGHSLLATQVISRIRESFSCELALRLLFESPTIAGLSEHLREVRRDNPLPPITKVNRSEALPLSFAQQRLWFLDQLEGENATYNMPAALRLEGKLQQAALALSLQEIVQRHESLRSLFPTVAGKPVQIIQSLHTPNPSQEGNKEEAAVSHIERGDLGVCYFLPIINLQGLLHQEQNLEVQRLVNEEAERPFDLSKGPLFRTTLLQLGNELHVLLVTMHHIISDGWSLEVVVRELSTLYQAFSQGKPSPLPPLTIQYVDFANWQRQWLQGEVLEKQSTYWKQQLADAPALLELPTDFPRPAEQRFQGATAELQLSPELTQQLKSFSQQTGTTLFMTLLSAFATLLSRYSGSDDIVIGSPIANRTVSQIEPLIGFFVNTLVLRIDLSGNPNFETLLTRVKQTALDAYAHQDIPFEQLVEELQPDRNLSHSPLFQVMLVLQNAPLADLELPGLNISFLESENITAKFDLLLSLEETAQGLDGILEYNTDLFAPATIARLKGHFQTLLTSILNTPQQAVHELPLLTASEYQQLVAWNNTATAYPHEQCIPDLFEAQVERTPQAIAVVFENQALTYQQLNTQANQLAHYLQTLGVKPEVLVGLCVTRSLAMVIGVLGILKAGGAYVPLDPNYPQERLAFMLEDAQISVLLTQSSLTETLPQSNVKTVCLDIVIQTSFALNLQGLANLEGFCGDKTFLEKSNELEILAIANEPFPISHSPENLAYVIYTSGSTGNPKGVAMTQGALVNLLNWQIQQFSNPEPAKTLQFAPISFDVSFQEMFSTWCSGGTLILISEELRQDAHALLEFLQQQAINRIFLPFVALQHLAEVAAKEVESPLLRGDLGVCYGDLGGCLPPLQEIITAGEQLQITPEITNWLQKLTGCQLHNHYGPSESHVVTAFTQTAPINEWPQLPPIGHPIANIQIHLLDTHQQPVPIGVPGELHIGGVGLARGYLNRPELTAEKFIPNPLQHTPNPSFDVNKEEVVESPLLRGDLGVCNCSRFYKTGDLARYLPDGNIEYLGRIDNQVKIRGFRIELAEIEAILAQHPGVQENVVIVQQASQTDKRLIAFIVLHTEQNLENTQLRHFMAERVPEYMVPSSFVQLDKIPQTPSGKIDRRALSQLSADNYPLSEKTFVAPRTSEEELLVGIWAEILGAKRIGVFDNFFELGGHSLLATQVISRIQDVFAIKLPLNNLFKYPTIAGLAERLEEVRLVQGLQSVSFGVANERVDDEEEEGTL